MQPQIETYKKEREKFLHILRIFPTNKRLTPLFGDWSSREILLHLVAWTEHQLRVVSVFKLGGIAERVDNTTIFNSEQVAERSNWDWDKAFAAWVVVGERLIKAYESIPNHMAGMQIWPEKNYTPKTYLKIEIDHLRYEHGPQIEAVIAKLQEPVAQ